MYYPFFSFCLLALSFFLSFCLHCYSHSLLLRDHLCKHQKNVNFFFFFCNSVLKKIFFGLDQDLPVFLLFPWQAWFRLVTTRCFFFFLLAIEDFPLDEYVCFVILQSMLGSISDGDQNKLGTFPCLSCLV